MCGWGALPPYVAQPEGGPHPMLLTNLAPPNYRASFTSVPLVLLTQDYRSQSPKLVAVVFWNQTNAKKRHLDTARKMRNEGGSTDPLKFTQPSYVMTPSPSSFEHLLILVPPKVVIKTSSAAASSGVAPSANGILSQTPRTTTVVCW